MREPHLVPLVDQRKKLGPAIPSSDHALEEAALKARLAAVGPAVAAMAKQSRSLGCLAVLHPCHNRAQAEGLGRGASSDGICDISSLVPLPTRVHRLGTG